MSDLLDFVVSRRGELMLLFRQHLGLVLLATLASAAIGIPLGAAMTRLPRLARPILAVANVFQTIPSLALFGFLVPLPFIGGIGARTALVALVLYALLPILRNTYVGILGVDRSIVEAAKGMGMTDGQRLRLVELPLAAGVIVAGLRVATVTSVGTATIAAAVGAGGLGTYVYRGIATLDTRLLLTGAVCAAAMALALDALLGTSERRPRRALVLFGALLAVLGLLSWVGRDRAEGPKIVVGSKNFTEQVILGEIAAAVLESEGFAVDRRLNLGGTTLCHEAARSGQIDLYYEYTGTALKDVLKRPTIHDGPAVLASVREGYGPLGLVVGAPLGFNNTFALIMRRTVAAEKGIARISDLARHAATLRVGLFGEFLEREDGMKGLLGRYGFSFAVPPREMDLGLLYRALGDNQVDVVVGSATDGLIEALDLVVLDDDLGYFPPYDAIPIVNARRAAEERHLLAALGRLDGAIDERAMRRMNHAVDGLHRNPRDVAREFVASLASRVVPTAAPPSAR